MHEIWINFVIFVNKMSYPITVLIQTRDEIDELFGKFGFSIKKWNSNDSSIGEKASSKKILGIEYNTDKDQLRVEMKISQNMDVTKRRILFKITEAWDP